MLPAHTILIKKKIGGCETSRRRSRGGVISQVDGSRPQSAGRHGSSSAREHVRRGSLGQLMENGCLKWSQRMVSRPCVCGVGFCLPGMSDRAARSLKERERSTRHANEHAPNKWPPTPPTPSCLHLAPCCLALDTCTKKICKVFAASTQRGQLYLTGKKKKKGIKVSRKKKYKDLNVRLKMCRGSIRTEREVHAKVAQHVKSNN